MRVTIAAVGRLKDAGEPDLLARYTQRFDASGRTLALGPLTVIELAESKLATAPLRKADESARLIKATASCDVLIALDEHGQQLSSTAFADRIARLRDDGCAHLAFAIGGPDGHGDDVLAAGRFKLALGPMTLPHGLARVVLVEQLYRTVTILSGHPYHRA